mmetsp:Transcript_31482/g.92136  ORF Transcript_31482/g.92136 Transcript_31482/m.92136 type:complete len:725 (-) Transcript_31482:70-2244(-)
MLWSQDMKVRITEDGEKEQAMYDKYACWCEKTTARKAKAIEDAKSDLRTLGNEILMNRGIVASKAAEIQATTADIKDNEQSQKEATAIRQKENAAWMAETSELQQAISALEKALIVLRTAQGGASSASALLQKRFMASEQGLAAAGRAVVSVAALQDAVASVPSRTLLKLENKGITAPKISLLRSYAEELTKSGSKATYTPQSATITGILDEMYSTFTEDLQDMNSDEADKQKEFEDLIATKQTELLELQDVLQKAREAKTEAEKKLAEAAQAYDDTEAQLKADVEFFDTTKLACTDKTDEWKQRKSLRDEELAGIGKALEILTSDEARELFGKAFSDSTATTPAPASFLQVASQEMAAPAEKAYSALKKQATRVHSLRLARVAAAVKLAKVGHFDEVIKAIDKLIEELHVETKDDIAKRDECKEEYNKINSTIADLTWKIEKNDAKIAKLGDLIKQLNEEKAQCIENIKAVKDDIATMKKTREDENAAFLAAKKDDEDAIKLLSDARDAVADYYAKHKIELGPVSGGEGVGLLQQGPEFERSEDEAPDATFSGKGHRKLEGKGVVSILTHLVEDLENEIKLAQKDEEAAQLMYEKQLKVAEDLQAELEQKEINLGQAITDREVDKTTEEGLRTENMDAKTAEENYKKDIEPDCDFAIDTFDERRQKREAELDGLRQAKEFLAGYQPPESAVGSPALLQGTDSGHGAAAAALLGLRPIAAHSFV